MTTCPAPSLRIRVAKAAPTSETNDSSISEPTRPRTSYALITRWTAAADRDIKGLLTVVAFDVSLAGRPCELDRPRWECPSRGGAGSAVVSRRGRAAPEGDRGDARYRPGAGRPRSRHRSPAPRPSRRCTGQHRGTGHHRRTEHPSRGIR